ncbi:MAG: Rossmann-like domain-containing protein [Candidatus Hodarchaeota archaeon]
MPTQLMKLSKQVLKMLKAIGQVENLIIKQMVIGVRYSCIQLKNGTTGVSFTYTNPSLDNIGFYQILKDGLLSDKPLYELIEFCSSKYGILRTVGVTALNTFCQANIDFSSAINQDVREILQVSEGDIIGMIGNIKPLSNYLSKKGIQMKILDAFAPTLSSQYIIPVRNISELESVDHLLVSGSALVFDNFDEIIDLKSKIGGKTILVGPSAQILPEIAFELGFSAIGSSRIINPDLTFKVIQQGGGYAIYRQYVKKYTFINPK